MNQVIGVLVVVAVVVCVCVFMCMCVLASEEWRITLLTQIAAHHAHSFGSDIEVHLPGQGKLVKIDDIKAVADLPTSFSPSLFPSRPVSRRPSMSQGGGP